MQKTNVPKSLRGTVKEERKPMRKACRQSKRGVILNAALVVFSNKGYNRATIADVAKKAKVATGSVYIYFKNKEDLLQHCITEFVAAEIDNIIEKTSHITDPIEKLYEFYNLHGILLETQPNVSRFLAVEARQNDLYLRSSKKAYAPMKSYLGYLKPLINNAIEHGTTKSVDPSTLAHVLVGSMDYVLWQSLSWGSNIDFENLVRKIVEIMSSGFRKNTVV
jgi:TetR/AcrR family fatty acid metabolism transcriptional regulator